jgi:hypothetical protein
MWGKKGKSGEKDTEKRETEDQTHDNESGGRFCCPRMEEGGRAIEWMNREHQSRVMERGKLAQLGSLK